MLQWNVADVMTRKVVSVGPEATYTEIVDAVVGNGVSAVPVVDVSGHVVGVVSEADLLPRVEATAADYRRTRLGRHTLDHKAHAMRAAELMTAPPITTVPEAPVATAARTMESAHVKRLPVVDADGRLIGIVSRRDLLRMYTRPDAAIRADVIDGVLVHSLYVDPATVDVRVVDGVVALDGTVETRSLARLAVKLAAGVPGVVQVVDRLHWEMDDSRPNRAHRHPPVASDHVVRPPYE
jgi:CBS domain-containing protein